MHILTPNAKAPLLTQGSQDSPSRNKYQSAKRTHNGVNEKSLAQNTISYTVCNSKDVGLLSSSGSNGHSLSQNKSDA